MYYEAEISIMSESYVDNDLEQGCDPYTTCDHGIVDTITSVTLEGLVKKLRDRYKGIEHFEGNRFETGYDETHRDGMHEYIMVSIYINRIERTELDNCSDLFKGVK